jgi:site-specific recombinase XerD
MLVYNTKFIMKENSPLPLFDTLENHQETIAPFNFPYPYDYEHAARFLYSYRGSLATFNSYRREIERYLQWTSLVAHKSLKEIKREDIENYLYFCQRPFVHWIGLKRCDRYIENAGKRVPNPAWRPFVAGVSKVAHRIGTEPSIKNYSLSQKALQAIFAILGSFYTYLIEEEYIDHNPVAQIRQKSKFIRKSQLQAPVRRLSELQWGYVMDTVRAQAAADPAHHERTLFIMTLLYGMYLRISELAASPRWEPQMGHFSRDSDNNWWFKTVGKGNKERLVTVSDAMLAALKRYREFLSLPALPSPGETTPLLLREKGRGPLTSTRQIRMIVQAAFDSALEQMQTDGLADDAEQLKTATVHWLRHTGISDDVKIRPREHVRDDAGHSSSAITDRYIDVELRERHASGRKKQIQAT